MPIYQFKCPECHKIEDHQMKMHDLPPICLSCFHASKTHHMTKCVTMSSIQFLGSGFYENDYKNKG